MPPIQELFVKRWATGYFIERVNTALSNFIASFYMVVKTAWEAYLHYLKKDSMNFDKAIGAGLMLFKKLLRIPNGAGFPSSSTVGYPV
jgi:hypothetical protein